MAGCGSKETDVQRANAANVLLWDNGSEPKSLDPAIATGVPENHIISSLLEGLIAYHPTDDTAIEPGMAESFDINEAGNVYTFHIRDAKWTNGDPVTADDFVYSYKRVLSPDLACEYVSMLFVVKNAKEYYESNADGEKPMDWDEVGIKALNSNTLEITLVAPIPYFPLMLKHYSWFPVNPKTIEKFGGMTQRGGEWIKVGNFVGNGPFRLKTWTTNQMIEVEKNPDYWDADTVRLNGIRFFPLESADGANRLFRNQQIHLTNTVPLSAIEGYESDHPNLIRRDTYLGVYFYRFNVTQEGPMSDPRVRRALAMTIDRESLIKNVLKGGQSPAYYFVPEGMGDYPHKEYFKYDPVEARRLLAEAGYPNGEGFPKKDILYNTLESHKTIAETFQQMWKENLGIEIGLNNQEWKVFLDATSNLDYDLSRGGWIGDYVDATTFLELFTTGNGNNDTGWSNERFDYLIQHAPLAPNEETRLEMLSEAETILMEEMPVLPVYIYTRQYLIDPSVKNWNSKLLDNHHMKYIWLEDTAR